jgi:amidophosphoribosyltransferase
MKRAVGSLNSQLDGFDASCFDGVYITGDITPESIAKMNAQRVDSSEEEGSVDVSRLALPNPQEA